MDIDRTIEKHGLERIRDFFRHEKDFDNIRHIPGFYWKVKMNPDFKERKIDTLIGNMFILNCLLALYLCGIN